MEKLIKSLELLEDNERNTLIGRFIKPENLHMGIMDTTYIGGYVLQQIKNKAFENFQFWPKLSVFEPNHEEIDKKFLAEVKKSGYTVLQTKVGCCICIDYENSIIEQEDKWNSFLKNTDDTEGNNMNRVHFAYVPTYSDAVNFTDSEKNDKNEDIELKMEGYVIYKNISKNTPKMKVAKKIITEKTDDQKRWEAPSSTGGKFWTCSRNGATVLTGWGKVGTKGQSRETIHPDEAKAIKFVETSIKKKEKEGYVLKAAKVSTPAKTVAKKAAPKKNASEENSDEDSEDQKPTPTSYVLPALYSIDAKGKERIFKIWVVGNKVTKMHGETKGKQIKAERLYEGKKTGRVNETDANEQANREAERDWIKQVDKGYKPKTKEGLSLYKKVQTEKAKQGGVNTNIAFVVALELRGVKITQASLSKTATVAKEKAKASKAKKKLTNGAMPNYKCDLFPMGCQKWAHDPKSAENPEAKVLKYFDFEKGVWIQKKLDGIRCLVRIVEDDDGKKWVVMMSRQGNQFVHLKHLREEVLQFLDGHEDCILDCEVYAEKLYGSVTYKGVDSAGKKKVVFGKGKGLIPQAMNFKAITSTVRSTMTDPGVLEDQMSLYVFDIVDPTETLDQDERFEILDGLFANIKNFHGTCPNIVQVERHEIHSVEEITEYHDKFAAEGYEGVVLRDRALKYECLKKNKKSKWMRKYKYFLDDEFEIIGIKADKGVDREQFTWICQTESGVKFYPKPEGTREMKWDWYDNSDDYIGKMLTVRYQGLEDSGKPRFPIGVEIRDYE